MPRFLPLTLAMSLSVSLIACIPTPNTSGQPGATPGIQASSAPVMPSLKKRSPEELLQQANAEPVPPVIPAEGSPTDKALSEWGPQLPPETRKQVLAALDAQVKAREAEGLDTLSGQIAEKNLALENWVVTAFAPSGRELDSQLSDAQGRFTLKNIPKGVRLHVLAYHPASQALLRSFYDTLPEQGPLTLSFESTVLARLLLRALQTGDSDVHLLPLSEIKQLSAAVLPTLAEQEQLITQLQQNKIAALQPSEADFSNYDFSIKVIFADSIFGNPLNRQIYSGAKQRSSSNYSTISSINSLPPSVLEKQAKVIQAERQIQQSNISQSMTNLSNTILPVEQKTGNLLRANIPADANNIQIPSSTMISPIREVTSIRNNGTILKSIVRDPGPKLISPPIAPPVYIKSTGLEILNLNAGPRFTAPSYRIQQANPAVPTLPEWRSASSLTQILQAGFFQTEFQARLVWNAKVSPEYSGAELFLQGPESRLISLNLAAIAQRKDAKPFEIGPLKVIPLGDQSVEVVLRDLTPLSSYQVLLRDVFNNQFTRPTADAQVSDFAGTLPAGVAVVPRQAPHWLGSTETSALRAPVGGFALQDGKESLIFLPRDLTAWLREQEEATRLKALPMAHLYQLPSRVWQESDVWGYHVRINGSEVINIPRADFAKYPAPSEAPEYLMIRRPNPEGLLLEADYQVVYREGKGPLSFRGFISHSQGAAAEPVPFLVQATPVQGQEYSQILLQFEGLPNAKRYRIFTEGRLLGFAEGLPGQLLSFRAEGLAADTRYEFVVEPERPEDPVTGKVVATTWRPTSGSGGGGGSAPVVVTPPVTPATPTITSLSVSNGTIGSTLIITGTGFDTTAGNNTVRFGTTTGTVNTASATSLNVTVPAGIFGTQNVTVTVAGQTNTGTNNFAVTPAITSFNPTSAPIGGSFTINGSGFDTTIGNNTVTLGGTAVTVTGATTTALTVTMPDKVANSYGTTVQVGAQTSASSNMTTLSTITTFAGTGTAGFSGDNGAATAAQLNQPWGLEINATGHLAIADSANHRVRFVAGSNATVFGAARTTGTIYTVAGDGTAAFGGDGGVGTAGQLNTPKGVTLSGANNLQIVDSGNARIRLVSGITSGANFNLATTAGNLYTLAGTGTTGAATNPVARFAVGDNQNGVEAVARHLNGTLYADQGNQFIRLASLINGTNFGVAVSSNTLHNVAGTGTGGFSGDAGAALSANLNSPGGLFNLQSPTTSDDNLYIADTGNHRIRLVPELAGTYFGQTIAANNIATVAGNGTAGFSGDGNLAVNAQLSNPRGIFVNATGLYIADTGNHRIRFVPATSGLYYGQNMTANFIYTIAGSGTAGFNNDGLHAPTAHLNAPYAVTVDAALNVYVSDRDNHRVRKISP